MTQTAWLILALVSLASAILLLGVLDMAKRQGEAEEETYRQVMDEIKLKRITTL